MRVILVLNMLLLASCVPLHDPFLEEPIEDCDCCEDAEENEYEDSLAKFNQWAQ